MRAIALAELSSFPFPNGSIPGALSRKKEYSSCCICGYNCPQFSGRKSSSPFEGEAAEECFPDFPFKRTTLAPESLAPRCPVRDAGPVPLLSFFGDSSCAPTLSVVTASPFRALLQVVIECWRPGTAANLWRRSCSMPADPRAQALTDPEQLLAAYFRSSTVGLAIVDPELRFLAVNHTLGRNQWRICFRSPGQDATRSSG